MKLKKGTIILFVISITWLSSHYLFQVYPIFSGVGAFIFFLSIFHEISDRETQVIESLQQNKITNIIAKILVIPFFLLWFNVTMTVFDITIHINLLDSALFFLALAATQYLTLTAVVISTKYKPKPTEVVKQ